MRKVLIIADFFPVDFVKNDPELQQILREAMPEEEFEFDYYADPLLNADCGITDPMSVIKHWEDHGIADVVRDQELLDKLADVEILIVQWSPVTRQMMDAAPKLKFVGSMRSGTENLDLEAGKEKGIIMRNCPGRLGDSVADLTLALILNANKAVIGLDLRLHNGEWLRETKRYEHRINRPMRLLTAGIVGFGAIGQKVAQRLKGFGTNLIAYDPYTPDAVFEQYGVKRVDLDTLMSTSDIITIHTRFTKETEGLIGKHEMSLIKDDVMFINTARAGLVDQEAFMEQLEAGKIVAAGFDVFWEEPFDPNSPLLQYEDIAMLPHVGGVFPGVTQLSVSMLMDTLKSVYLNK